MIVRLVLSLSATTLVLVVLASQLRDTSAPPAAAEKTVAVADGTSSNQQGPVVLPVEKRQEATPQTFDVVSRDEPSDLADERRPDIRSDEHLMASPEATLATDAGMLVPSRGDSTAGEELSASRSGHNLPVRTADLNSPSDDEVSHNLALKSIEFDDALTSAAHSLSRVPTIEAAAIGPVVTRNAEIRTVSDIDTSSDAENDETDTEAVADQAEELSPRMLALKARIEQVLDHYRPRMLNTRDRGHWATMHSLIAFGVEKELRIGGPSGRKVNAIGWIAWNGRCAGERLFYLSNGKIHARTGPGVQGHHGQFLAIIAQSRVKASYPMKIGGMDFTVADLIRREQETCVPHSELTFKLIGLSHYLDSEEKWKDEHGRDWSISRMVKEELAQPIIGAACGGTHRLFGLTYAMKKREKQGYPIDGQFKRAATFLDEYEKYTFKLQNSDGSYSTQFFAARGADSRRSRRLETTGHIAEWLSLRLDDEKIESDRMVKSIEFLSDMLYEGRHREWKIGPLGHGLHALNMYHQRVFASPAVETPQVATDEERIRTAAKPGKKAS